MTDLTIALDVMGGDVGPRITIPATIRALESNPRLHLLLFGDSQQILPLLSQADTRLKSRYKIYHCEKVITNDLSVGQSLRQSKGTSMRLALESVKNGQAKACVSAGNTGVLMGLSKILLQPLEGILRPALMKVLPTVNNRQSVMLDLGANIECTSEQLYQFSLMGVIFAEHILRQVYPRVCLLNIGSEEVKGLKSIKETANRLKQNDYINYQGFIEGNLLLNDYADVIICDGFIGNIALKTLEGTLKNILSFFKSDLPSNWVVSCIKSCLFVLVKILFKKSYQRYKRINPEKYNGASLLGLTAVVIKSHGSATSEGFYYAILDAIRQVELDIPTQMQIGLQQYEQY